jgi:hypothetical protein
MTTDAVITRAFEGLAQSLRVLLEADYHANQNGLLIIDRAEAVGNIETALSAVLNAFHSLYDGIEKQISPRPIDWYASGPLATVLAARNARHHQQANGVRTLYSYHVEMNERPDRMAQYVLVDFIAPEEGADTFDVHVSWGDFDRLLKLPQAKSRLRTSTCQLIRDYLASDRFEGYAQQYDLPVDRVFVNIVPLLVNAGAEISPYIRNHVGPNSTESKFFLDHFCTLTRADTHDHEVDCGPFVLANWRVNTIAGQ